MSSLCTKVNEILLEPLATSLIESTIPEESHRIKTTSSNTASMTTLQSDSIKTSTNKHR
ncbi:hypothetical protein LguiA_032779 [Lonicera macranthoides]